MARGGVRPGSGPRTLGGKPFGLGRPKGAKNKVSGLAKEAIAMAAEGLGGTDRLIAWAKEDPQNERTFWGSIYPRLLPVQVTGEDGDPIQHEITVIRRTLVDPRH